MQTEIICDVITSCCHLRTILLSIFSTFSKKAICDALLSADLYPLLLFTLIGTYRFGPLKLA